MGSPEFLHRHPIKEQDLGLDEGHVIVDKEDWQQALILFEGMKHVVNKNPLEKPKPLTPKGPPHPPHNPSRVNSDTVYFIEAYRYRGQGWVTQARLDMGQPSRFDGQPFDDQIALMEFEGFNHVKKGDFKETRLIILREFK